MDDYSFLALLADTWGTFAFIAGFLLVIVYAFLPSNRSTYDKAAQLPLEED